MARKPKAAKAPKIEAPAAPASLDEIEINVDDDEPAPVAVATPIAVVAPVAVATIEVRSEPVKIEPVIEPAPVAAAPTAPAGPAWKRWRLTKKST